MSGAETLNPAISRSRRWQPPGPRNRLIHGTFTMAIVSTAGVSAAALARITLAVRGVAEA